MGVSNFITNSNTKHLTSRLRELIKVSRELKFLVGFFYFSGISELYEALKENEAVTLKILVGLNVDRVGRSIVELPERFSENCRNPTMSFLSSIREGLNDDFFDNPIFCEQVKFFLDWIRKNRLIIRKTREPNHAKLYIFRLKEDQVARETLFITGSSNLTKAGLTTQNEFNVEISDYGVEDAERYFDELWDFSYRITEQEEIKKQIISIIEKETFLREITPYEAYALALKIYLDSFKRESTTSRLKSLLEEKGYNPYTYQIDAIQQALAILKAHNGVILADVVGLGKTVMACAIANELRERGVIICPPSLKGDEKLKDSGWNMYKEEFNLCGWEVWSLGELEKLEQALQSKLKNIGVVIVDEAHRFRNEDTKAYELLKNICRNKKVILLTATPFNNRPRDILSLLKLFVVPKRSGITLDDDVEWKFTLFESKFKKLGEIRKYYNSVDPAKKEEAHRLYRKLFGELPKEDALERVKRELQYLAKEIRDVIEPVTIRRNRLDLKSNPYYRDEIKFLPEVKDPIEWFYELTHEQSRFYDEVIEVYFGDPLQGGRFKGAMYRPFDYEAKRDIENLSEEENREYWQQRNLYNFMRRLLVKRFESSFGAFRQSLVNFHRISKTVYEFIRRTNKYILDRALLEKIYQLDLDEIEIELKNYEEKMKQFSSLIEGKVYDLEEFFYKKEFIEDVKSDMDMFSELLSRLDNLNLVTNDPKVRCLVEKLQDLFLKEPDRKVVLFSEYIDTVEYLYPILNTHFNGRVLKVSGNLTRTKLREVMENFDASYIPQENRYDILLTTDKLSEGFNLNRAGMVINYDIPWNPVRVIQRLGRINRIGKKVFDYLYIVNFFPSEQGASIVQAREIASNKMFLIHNTLGEDAKIFHIDEEPTPAKLYDALQRNPDNLEEKSLYTRVLEEFQQIKEKHPDLISSLENMPSRVKVAKKGKRHEIVVLIRKNDRVYIRMVNLESMENKKIIVQEVPFEEVLEKIKCDLSEQALSLSESFWDAYLRIKKFQMKRKPLPEQSLERKAANNLRTLLKRLQKKGISDYITFAETLLEDIEEYGTLPDYTLREIASWKTDVDRKALRNVLVSLKKLRSRLGGDYLEKEKKKYQGTSKEVIVAIENRKVSVR